MKQLFYLPCLAFILSGCDEGAFEPIDSRPPVQESYYQESYRDPKSLYCRETVQKVTIDGREETIIGKSCRVDRGPDGSGVWVDEKELKRTEPSYENSYSQQRYSNESAPRYNQNREAVYYSQEESVEEPNYSDQGARVYYGRSRASSTYNSIQNTQVQQQVQQVQQVYQPVQAPQPTQVNVPQQVLQPAKAPVTVNNYYSKPAKKRASYVNRGSDFTSINRVVKVPAVSNVNYGSMYNSNQQASNVQASNEQVKTQDSNSNVKKKSMIPGTKRFKKKSNVPGQKRLKIKNARR